MRGSGHDSTRRLVLLSMVIALMTALAVPAMAQAEEGEEPPTIITENATGVSRTAAVINALVNPNGAAVEECEFEFGTSPGSLNQTAPCSPFTIEGEENFVEVSAALQKLTEGTKYYYRVVASNVFGESVSSEKSFTTLPTKPTATATNVNGTSRTSTTLKGLVNPNDSNVTACEFEWATSPAFESPGTAECAVLPGSGEKKVEVSAHVATLTEHTHYYFRVKATNAQGTSVSAPAKFSTPPTKPTATSEAASEVTRTSATLNASVNPRGSQIETCEFEYGTSIAFGSRIECSSLPGSGEHNESVSAHLTGLPEGTTFYFRIFAKNAFGEAFGSHPKFTTLPSPPKAVTVSATKLAANSAQLNANVNPDGFEVTDCEFEYGTSIAYGLKVPCTMMPGSGESPVAVLATPTGLAPHTNYDYRIVAANVLGTSFGQNAKFTTEAGGLKPVLTKMAPRRGSVAGGTKVKIKGTGFTEATAVTFGSVPAASYKVESGTLIVAVTPAEAAGEVTVTVTTPSGTSEETAADRFKFQVKR